MKRKLLKSLLFFIVLLVTKVSAQDRTVTGVVRASEDGLPILGVSIRVANSKTGTTTGADGKYAIKVGENAIIQFSSVGYLSKLVKVTGSNEINVSLALDAKALTDVVITGYGTQSKKEIGGAVSKITGSQFENQPMASPQSALQGRVSGVVVQANNGIPGGGINVRIRGVGSFSASTQPLYVVDGIQLSGETFSGYTQTNTLAGINSDDIESIEVLKDAASASIYGSQAANGVVIITTKKGKAGKTKLNFNYYNGVQNAIKKFDVLNTQDYFQLRTEAYQNANPTVAATTIRNTVLSEMGLATTLTNDQVAALPSYNWQDEAFRTGHVSNYEVSATGGNEKTKFFVSGAYSNQDAVLTKADFKRGVFKVNLDHQVTDKLSFNANINLSTYKQIAPYSISGSYLSSPAFSAALILPSNPIYNADGSYYGLYGSGQTFYGTINSNIAAANDYSKGSQNTNSLLGSFSASYKILPELIFKSAYSIEYRDINGQNYRDPRTNDGYNILGGKSIFSDERNNIQTSQTLNFDKTFNNDHKISALAGFEYRYDKEYYTYAYGTGFPTYQFTDLSSAATPSSISETFTGFKKISTFGRVAYSYKGKYNVSASVRYDGSSRFSENNKFGLFPGVTAAWNISDENFLKNASWISNLKLRASYGQAGNDRIGDFASQGLFTGGYVYNGASGIGTSTLANTNLKWEKATTYDLGLDFGLWKNRLSGSVGVFLKRSTDLLLDQPLMTTTGYSTITTNVGALENKGFELELNSVNIQTKDGFKWTSNFNFTYIKNTVKKLYGGYDILPSNNALRVGWDLGAIYTYEYAGVNPATGRPFWYDANGNVTYSVTAADRKKIGSTLPKYTGGFTNNFSYKGFDLSVMFQYQMGQMAYDSQVAFLSEDGRRAFNTLQSVYDNRWTTPGQITSIARPYNGGSEAQGSSSTTGSWLYYYTDYIRMKEAQIGYTFSPKILSKISISNLRVYAQGTNLVTFTKFPGYDPEFYDSSNSNAGAIPQSRNFTFGIQLGL
nr:TonB-dependent receptor [Pedobacter sp. ASV2]